MSIFKGIFFFNEEWTLFRSGGKLYSGVSEWIIGYRKIFDNYMCILYISVFIVDLKCLYIFGYISEIIFGVVYY